MWLVGNWSLRSRQPPTAQCLSGQSKDVVKDIAHLTEVQSLVWLVGNWSLRSRQSHRVISERSEDVAWLNVEDTELFDDWLWVQILVRTVTFSPPPSPPHLSLV